MLKFTPFVAFGFFKVGKEDDVWDGFYWALGSFLRPLWSSRRLKEMGLIREKRKGGKMSNIPIDKWLMLIGVLAVIAAGLWILWLWIRLLFIKDGKRNEPKKRGGGGSDYNESPWEPAPPVASVSQYIPEKNTGDVFPGAGAEPISAYNRSILGQLRKILYEREYPAEQPVEMPGEAPIEVTSHPLFTRIKKG